MQKGYRKLRTPRQSGTAITGKSLFACIVCRFSCGAASAVATKLTLARYGQSHDVVIHYSDTRSEHPHNERFLSDCERWFGRSVTRLHPARYHDVWDVWEKRRMLAFGARDFAPCTDEAGTSVGASACAQLIARTVYLDVPVDIESEAMSVSI